MNTVICVRKPPEYKAFKYTGDNLVETLAFLGHEYTKEYNPVSRVFTIYDLTKQISPDDWIVLDMDQFAPLRIMNDEKFKEMYNQVMVLE
jgi:hypothetical protein